MKITDAIVYLNFFSFLLFYYSCRLFSFYYIFDFSIYIWLQNEQILIIDNRFLSFFYSKWLNVYIYKYIYKSFKIFIFLNVILSIFLLIGIYRWTKNLYVLVRKNETWQYINLYQPNLELIHLQLLKINNKNVKFSI